LAIALNDILPRLERVSSIERKTTPLAFYLWSQKGLAFGIFEKPGMVESSVQKILRYDWHPFEAEIIQNCAVGSDRKITLPRNVENIEDEDILPF
jgi:hypothetical protein